MIPIGCSGLVSEGRLAGWWVRVQPQSVPQGFLVTRARAPEMLDTVVVDGLFPDREALERFFQENASKVAWQE